MINPVKFILNTQLKRSGLGEKPGGFTLIELLVAMILAVLVLAPLLGFMINILSDDRKEQAKGNSEQEVQSALDYIAQDVSQAIYIYDADGLTNNYVAPSGSNPVPTNSGIKDQIPPVAAASNDDCQKSGVTCTPVLVFWKRQIVKNAFKYNGDPCDASALSNKECNDTFIYSLVGYYLVTDSSSNSTWSPAARIARFEIHDGVANPVNSTTNGTVNYISGKTPSPGFKKFDLVNQSGGLKQKMNQWSKDSAAYTDQTQVLVDYIDQTTGTSAPPDPITCDTTNGDSNLREQRVPPVSNSTPNSFYACVNSTTGLARIYIRGNALARIYKDSNSITYNNSRSAYFPKATMEVKGNGALFTQ